MSEESTAQIINLEHWMGNLPDQLKDIPFIYLAIPGSHDSMTFGINASSGLAPDAEPILHRLYPLFRGTIIRWTVTQALDTMQQLLIGIRYLDLRLATKPGSSNFFFTHGLYADEITESLNQVKQFVDSHPGEVVILDFQHFYGFTPDDHQRLMGFLLNMFRQRIVPRQIDLRAITLNTLSRLRQQIVVVYRNQAVYATGEFWQPQMLPSPWPQTAKTTTLISYLEHLKRHPGMGFVHQAVLTPTPSFIVFRSVSGHRRYGIIKRILPTIPRRVF
ncbi:unnamed protein product [Chilo suppressalis]|uniref:Phosphatidylinositol-specific phospholipase C X domain-containing protein n=1 Tax=Chilo suppressalis TaxID=168631 RepID=A0ABN8L307_CHISP|nr:unnamed protein product [Chilo suppressalis]